MSTFKDNLYTDKNIHVRQILNLDLWVSDTKNPSLGLRLILPGQSSLVFILSWEIHSDFRGIP
jgi:hypothetical protein